MEKPLGQLAKFQKGRKVATSDYQQDGYESYLGASSLEGSAEGYATTKLAVIANPSDVLMLWDGERSGLVGHNLSGVVSSTVSRLIPSNEVTSTYLYYHLLSRFEWIQGRRTGTGVPHVPKDLSRILKVYYPTDTTEQDHIADVLTCVDATIKETESLIAKYQQIKAGLMHDLFTRGVTADGKLRTPREQAPELYHETPIGWIPKEWEVKSLNYALESVVDGPFGSNLKTEHYVVDPGVRVVRLQNVVESDYNDNDRAYISERHASYLLRNKVVGGDVLIAGLGEERYPVGRACCYPDDIAPAINKADCFRARCNPQVMKNRFFMLFLNSGMARRQVRRYEQGVTRPRINTSNLKRISISVPSLEEQSQIVAMFDAVQSVIQVEQDNVAKLRDQKLGLMSYLLTGSVRVKFAETEVVSA
jgi:type I restriction enzyme S subunit